MQIQRFVGAATLLAAVAFAPAVALGASCESVISLALPQATVTLAESVGAGQFSPPPGSAGPGGRGGPAVPDLAAAPAFCRVAATMRPTRYSDIRIEVWMPSQGWNGKFLGVGNGGWAGTINYPALAEALRRGYAVASTDTGHTGTAGDASFALGNPEKLIDFGYRAVHEMTVAAKAIVSAFYDDGPRFSYWNGCSTGGKQGLTEAQRFPGDYDGIIAGAPANYWTHLMAGLMWVGRATLSDSASYIPPAKFAVVNRAALNACDALDGVTDGVIDDPRRCRFDPKVLACDGADGPTCLTSPQVAAVQKIYAPATNPRTGAVIFPGFPPGGELGWVAAAGGPEPFQIPDSYFARRPRIRPELSDTDFDATSRVPIGPTRASSTPSTPTRRRSATWGQAADVPRLERPDHHRAEYRQLLRERQDDTGPVADGVRSPPLHGAGGGALPGGAGAGPRGLARCARSVG
jgi:feruloyl esterase